MLIQAITAIIAAVFIISADKIICLSILEVTSQLTLRTTLIQHFLLFALDVVKLHTGFVSSYLFFFALMHLIADPVSVHALENGEQARCQLVHEALVLFLLPLLEVLQSRVGF